MNDGWGALNEMQGSGKSEEISISPGALDESQNHVRRHTNSSRTREQSVREWVQQDQIELDVDGFEESSTGEGQISEYLNSGDDFDYADTGGLSISATKSGVASVAQDLYQQDLVTVDTPEMDRSGVSGSIEIGVDEDRIGDYLEEVQGEFESSGDPQASASAAVALGLESIFQAVEQNYDGEVSISDYDHMKPQNNMPSSVTPSRAYEGPHEGEDVVGDSAYIPEAGEAAVDAYQENIQEAERERRQQEQEDDGGFLGLF